MRRLFLLLCLLWHNSYEWINYAQISNSFILLMALNENKARNKALTVGEVSEIIAQKSKGPFIQGSLYTERCGRVQVEKRRPC